MTIGLLPDEEIIFTSKANAVIVPSDYGLSQFAAGYLLGLAELGGREAIGGHLHITTVRVAFAAHAFNRLNGVFSIPISAITSATKYRSGLAMGVEIETVAARLQFVNWSGDRVLTAITDAQQRFGQSEAAILASVGGAFEDMSVRPSAEVADMIARIGIDLTGATPSWMDALSILEWRTAAQLATRIASIEVDERAAPPAGLDFDASPVALPTPSPSVAASDPTDLLQKLGALRDAGILTEEEFASKKAEILSRL